ncbi:XdhC/CoxI family protein [Desulfovibrio sp.]|uniref:XdhC family protein n=1 Tax=Desulfovibrio sp. TaxID=885 RepID=UPI0025B8D609|nr:XdhC/CoxI family protein [Desulfovibrio sp.]
MGKKNDASLLPSGGEGPKGTPESLVTTPWEDTLEARATALLTGGEPLVLVTVVSRTGSAPREAGTRALQTRNGFEGTVGGGLLEARAMEAARNSLASGLSARVSCDMSGFTPNSDMICGGGMEVLCEVLAPRQAEMFALAAEVLRLGGKGAWLVELRRDGVSLHGEAETPQRRLVVGALPEHTVQPEGVTVGLDAVTPLLETRKGRPGLVDVDGRILYVEPLDAPPVLLLCGGGHVSLEVARLAHSCGFVVDVVDDREEFSNAGRFPMARHCRILPGYENLVQTCDIGRRHFVAIITRGHSFDREALAQALTSHAQYVGMIGSRTKREQVYAALRKQGVPDAELAAVCCPIGLSIEAETPQQIAVSIVAELLAARAGTLVRLRFDD